jgi:hypothetical protein
MPPDSAHDTTADAEPARSHAESPFKGKTGLTRVWNALHYSLAGLGAAYRHEDAFRQETWQAARSLHSRRTRNGALSTGRARGISKRGWPC